MTKSALFRNHEMLKNTEGDQNQEGITRKIAIDKAVERFHWYPMKRFNNQSMNKETWCLQKVQRAFQGSTPEGLLSLVKRNYSRLFVLTGQGKLSSRVEDRDFRVKPVKIVPVYTTQKCIHKFLQKRRSDLDKTIELRNLKAHQSINQGFSNFIWRGYEYEAIRHYIDVLTANTAAMNQAICLGFQIWYSLMPSLMLTIGNYDFHFILSPDFYKSFKDSTREWSPQTIKLAEELCEDLSHSLMHAAGSTLETGGASTSGCGTSAESNETGTFDPLGIRAREETHKVVLRKLVISCLAVCLLSTVSYITVGGTELCQQFMEGKFKE
ncbi:unnamed protein product [Ilex paraguariensis]|uniref:Uncharacterized protein n=1 Tax=Ilex paraguariensis TaxID=185542 RepID=A0ABC8T905_9AQUA